MLLWVRLVWDSLNSLDLCDYFLHQIREVFGHYFFKQFLNPLLALLSFCYSHDADVVMLHVVQNISYILLIFQKFSFLFGALPGCFFSTLSSKSLIRSSASSNLLFIPSSVLFISDIALFISNWSFLIVSMYF